MGVLGIAWKGTDPGYVLTSGKDGCLCVCLSVGVLGIAWKGTDPGYVLTSGKDGCLCVCLSVCGCARDSVEGHRPWLCADVW